MLRRWLLVQSAILMCLGVLASPGYAAQSEIVGGPGGSAFTIECPPNAFVFGFDIRYGSALDQIKPTCAVVKDGKFTDERSQPGWTGGNGGKPGQVYCPAWQGLAGLDVYVDPNSNIRRFNMMCYLPGPSEVTVVGSPEIGGANFNGWAHCPPNQFVHGIVGRSGTLVDAIGVLCAELPKAAPAPAFDAKAAFDALVGQPTVEHCQAANSQCQQRVQAQYGMGVNAAGVIQAQCTQYLTPCIESAVAAAANNVPPENPQPAGETATVVLDVEVYSGPDGNPIGDLQVGDKVTLVGCQDDGWCHVQGDNVPNGDGYVYSGPDYNSLGR